MSARHSSLPRPRDLLRPHLLVLAILSASLRDFVASYPVPDDTTSPPDSAGQLGDTIANGVYTLSAQQAILGGVCMGIGALLLFLGFKLYRPTLFICGVIFGSCAGYIILIHAEPHPDGYPSRSNVLLFGSLAFGLLIGGMFLCLRKLALLGIGAVSGFFLAMFVLGLRSYGVVDAGWGRAVFIAVFCLAGVVAVFFLEKHVVIVGTAVTGAYGLVFGIDCFAHTGFVQASESFVSSTSTLNFAAFVINGRVIALMVSFVALAVIGIVVQYRINKDKGFAEKATH
ncbi:hypothetical protein DFJ73DRAFT_849176 [Zopfochytrium polystomum]|nr:hypothetical protein DFJ73DRAFT_849176 [Zopfochytrium polystomum]